MARPESTSFESLVDRYGREIYAYAWRILRDQAAAEDCLQETYLKAYVAFDELEPDANYRAWLYKIAGNTALTYLRRNYEAELVDIASEAPSVESQAEQNMQLEQIRGAVDRLPDKQRMAMILRNYQGLSYHEVGAALDISSDAARANVYQATKKLRSQFTVEPAVVEER